jgi:hypothetical protein
MSTERCLVMVGKNKKKSFWKNIDEVLLKSSSLLGPGLLFSFVIFFTQTVGLLGRVISPCQGRYLHTAQHNHRINAHTYPCLEWGPNSCSHRSSEDNSCLRPRGYSDRQKVTPGEHKLRDASVCLQLWHTQTLFQLYHPITTTNLLQNLDFYSVQLDIRTEVRFDICGPINYVTFCTSVCPNKNTLL